MLDIFMLIMIIVCCVVLLVVSIYILAYYCHPEDSGFGSGLICKIFVILGLFIAFGQILLLPLDVANTRGEGGGLRMDLVYPSVYIAMGIFAFFILPLLTAIYESDPDDTFIKKICGTFCFLISEIIIIILAFGLGYVIFNEAKVPVSPLICSLELIQNSFIPIKEEFSSENLCYNIDSYLKINVSFPIFCIGFFCFISYFLFTIFGGVGLFALPMDMIYSFISRPKKINKNTLELMKKDIVETAADLKELALSIKTMEDNGFNKKTIFSSEKRQYNKLLNQLKAGVSCVSEEYDLVNVQKLLTGTTILISYINLACGIIFLLLTFVWIFQIFVYVIIKKNGKALYLGLNAWLTTLTENNVSFLAIAIFGILCLYLLLCTMKGNFKLGVRFFILGSIHPMKKNQTYMNSFLFNITLLIIASVSVNQFCLKSFNEYAAMTDFDLIFSNQIEYLGFFLVFDKYHVFDYTMCAILVITFFYLIIFPSDSRNIKKELYKIQAEENQNISKNSKKETFIEMTDKN